MDYGSGKRTEIKSNLNVIKKSDGVWTFEYIYPDEPKANSSSEVALADSGKTFNWQTVTSKQRRNGTLEIITTKDGDDNKKKTVPAPSGPECAEHTAITLATCEAKRNM